MCFDSTAWICSECKLGLSEPIEERGSAVSLSAAWLFFLAFGMIFVGMILMALGAIPSESNASLGGVILIGPIPIMIGAGPYSSLMLVLATALTLVSLAAFLILRRKR